MIAVERHGTVTRFRFSTGRSRSIGYEVSAFLVNGILIDCGFPDVESDLGAIVAEFAPRGVLITHHHEDHAGNIEYLARNGVPLSVSDATLALVRKKPSIGFYRKFCWGTPTRLTSPVTRFEPTGLEVVFAPGHSSDHNVVWDPSTRTLFSADLFLGVKVRVARPGEDVRQLARSLRTIARLEPATMFDSHRGLVPDPVGSLNAKADWLDATIGRIDQLGALGMNDYAIRREVLGREDAAYWFSAGDLSRINFVRAALQLRADEPTSA